jgi:hypothetical protein
VAENTQWPVLNQSQVYCFSYAGDNSRKCGELRMCEKCVEIDRRIALLKKMIEQLADPATVETANKMIEEMEARKVQLHPT